MSAGATFRRPLRAEDFRPLVGRRVLVAGGFTVIGANGTTVVESVEDELVVLRTGKVARCAVRCAQVDCVISFPDDDVVGSRAQPTDPERTNQ